MMSPLGGGDLILPLSRSPLIVPSGGNWWEAGGATGVIAAYQPKGAANYAAALVNLANPGVHDAFDSGDAVGFNTAIGWTFDNGPDWIETDITPDANTTIIIQFANGTIGRTITLAGSTDGSYAFYLMNDSGDPNNVEYHHGALDSFPSPHLAAGNMAMTNTGYRNGVAEGGTGSTTGSSAIPIWIGLLNINNTAHFGYVGDMIAVGIYGTALLDATMVAGVAAAMAAL